MVNIRKQINLLKQDGYRNAAALMERMAGSVNLRAEFDYLKCFATEGCFTTVDAGEQLRVLWTAYCFHTGAMVDTGPYDLDLQKVWACLDKREDCLWSSYDEFDSFMCENLV